jgi:hypothetical protein
MILYLYSCKLQYQTGETALMLASWNGKKDIGLPLGPKKKHQKYVITF